MRVCLVSHGFPPYECTGVENYTEALALALVRAGHEVEVFAPRKQAELAELAVRRTERDGFAVTFVTTNSAPRDAGEGLEPPGLARTFGAFLDRESPEVVHFQHVIKLGVGLIEEAATREIPTLYTAHDYYAVCHRYTLLRPDLARCETIGEPRACARCDRAVAYLNGVPGLGDYQAGAGPEQLDDEQQARLAALLEPAADAEPAFEAGLKAREALDQRRAEAFAQIDRWLAPSRFLAARLAGGGVDAARIEHLPYGIDTASLREIPPPREEGDGPLRVAFLGGLSKQKGVDVLLESWALLEAQGRAELSIWGSTSDARWLDLLQARASEVGARWRGSYDRDGLARALGDADVVVVPSIWVENYPIVIREALAAGRPVVASRVGALPESVEDGVDGLLFEPGDAADLARVFARMLAEPELLPGLRAGIRQVHDIDAQVLELTRLYAQVCAEHEQERRELPASLVPFDEEKRALDHLPMRALFAQALSGIGQLRGRLGGELAEIGPEELLTSALSRRARAKVLLRDHQDQARWLKHTNDALGTRQQWLNEVIAGKDRGLESLREELGELARGRDSLTEEAQWLRGLVEAKDTELEYLREKQSELKAHVLEVEMEREALRIDLAGSSRVLSEQRRELLEELGQAAELGLEALAAQERLLRQELDPLVQLLDRVDPPSGQADELADGFDADLRSLVRAMRGAVERLETMQTELDWRRDQMLEARQLAARKPLSSLLGRTGLGRLVATWGEQEQQPSEESS